MSAKGLRCGIAPRSGYLGWISARLLWARTGKTLERPENDTLSVEVGAHPRD